MHYPSNNVACPQCLAPVGTACEGKYQHVQRCNLAKKQSKRNKVTRSIQEITNDIVDNGVLEQLEAEEDNWMLFR